MSLLAIDTCFQACSAAVRVAETGRTAARFERMDQGHAERLVPMIAEVMAEAGIGFAGLSAIACTTGPGTFTGVRIGIAAARALSLAHGIATLPASSLAVMAAAARAHPALADRPLAIAVDARRGRLFLQRFGADGGSLAAPALVTIADAAALADPAATAVGCGGAMLAGAAAQLGKALPHALPDLQPDAAFLLRMPGLHADLLSPAYLRPPDARPPIGGSLRRAP